MNRSAETSSFLDEASPSDEDSRPATPERSRAELTTRTLLAYGGLALPLSLAEIPILLYLPAFYAQEVGLSPGLVGLAFLFARLWDGVADMVVGWLSDRYQLSWGRRKPWVMLGTPLLMISTWFLCNPGENAGLLYLAILAPLFYAADALVKIPYLSWGSELSGEYVERSRVTAFRETFSMLGTLFFVSAPLIFLPSNAPLNSVLFVISIAVIVIVPLMAIPLGLLVRDPPQVARSSVSLLGGLRSLARDRVLVMFSVVMLFSYTANGIINSLAVFSFGVGLQLQDKLFWVVFILYASTLFAVPFTVRLFRHREKHRLFVVATLLLAAAYACHLMVPAGNFPAVAGLWIIAGIGNAAALILPTSILADIIDRGEAIDGIRRSGAYMAIYNLIKKIGLALGVGLAFGSLELIGYSPGAAQHSAVDAFNIRLLGFGLPALLMVPPILLMWRYPIDRKVQQQLRATIDARSGAVE